MLKQSQLLAFFGLLVAVILAGCGSSGTGYGSSTTNAGSGATATNTPAAGGSTTTGTATIKIAAVTAKGVSKMVLTNDKGLTLYYRTDDTATTPACTGGCLTTWPPVLSQGVPTAPSGVTGTFTVLSDSSRPQVEYNGHPLYTFADDTAPGDANGEGIAKIWFVAAPADLKPQTALSGTAPTATPSSGYTYGG